MRTVAELRAAMVEQTADLAPRVTVADVTRRARRRRLRRGGLFGTVSLLPALAAVLVGALQPTQPSPGPTPHPTVSIVADPSFPPMGDVITTGLRIGGNEELVFWFSDGAQLNAGLRDRATGVARKLSAETGLGGMAELVDRHGGVIDYGVFHGDVARITVATAGLAVPAELARWSKDPSYVVFWARRVGTPLPPTSAPQASPDQQPQFTAYDANGEVLGTGTGAVRTDGGVVAEDQPQVGETIHTGVPTADGGELVFWFVGDATSAILRAGVWNPASRAAAPLTTLGSYHRPPFPIGFYLGYQQIPGPDSTVIDIATYAGPATRVTLAHPAPGVAPGCRNWSAHRELFVCWIANVPAATSSQLSGVAFDAHGTIIATSNFRN